MAYRLALMTAIMTGLAAVAAAAPCVAEQGAAPARAASPCFGCGNGATDTRHSMTSDLPWLALAAGEQHRYRIARDVVVRGWKFGESLYFGHTRSRLGRAGVGVTYDAGSTQYTLNHQGFTVTRRL